MAFTGGASQTSGGFTGSSVVKTGFAGRRRPRLTPQEKKSELEDIAEDLVERKGEIEDIINDLDTRELGTDEDDELDDFADEVLDRAGIDDMADLEMDRLAELISRSQLIDNLENLSEAQRRDFVYNSLDEFGINPYEDDVKLESISFDEIRKSLGEAIATEWNDVMDGFGKIAEGLQADTQIFDDLEAYSDVVRAIISGDPKYLEEAVLERLGVEFDDEGNFDLRNTLSDNLSPVFGRLMYKKVFQPLSKKIGEYLGGSVGETLADEEALAASLMKTTEVREFESLLARGMASTLGQEFGEGAAFLFEGAAPLFAVVGALQATGALTRIISSVLRKSNLKHDAYVEENHQWFGTKPEWDWLKYTGPLYDAISGTAELIADIADRQDYLVGDTPRQRYEQKKELHNFAFRIYEDVIKQIADPDFNGALDFSQILNEARNYPKVAKNRFFSITATQMATDLKFFLQDIVDGKIDRETTLRPTTGDPIYRGLDTINAKDMSLGQYLNEYNLQVLEDELQMYSDFRAKMNEAIEDENVYDEEGRNIPAIRNEISDLEEMIRRRSSKKIGDILGTQYHYSMPLGGQQRRKDQADLTALQETLEALEEVQREREADLRNLASQEQKVLNTLEKLGVSGYTKTEEQYRQMYKKELEERGRELVEAPLRFRAYQKLKQMYGDSMSDDQLRRFAGYGQYRDAFDRMPLTGTGPDNIITLLGLTMEDYEREMEEALDLSFDQWYLDYLDNLQTL